MGTLSGLEDNPFVGPRPIQQGEPLYGRDAEVEALYCELLARRIVVLHSPSGAGKSSLVQAGLIPKLEAGGFAVWRPVRVNLDVTTAQGVPEGTNRYLLSALSSLEDELPRSKQRSLSELAQLDLSTYLQTRPRRKKQLGRPLVLLLDQFEEVLTVAPQAVEAKRAFFSALGQALEHENTWALLIIREDFLAAFAPYRDRLPSHMTHTFRLDRLGTAGARDAAVALAAAGGRRFVAVDSLVRELATTTVQQADGTVVSEQGRTVEPVQLQVVCRRLWASMPANATSIEQAHVDEYARVSESLAGYYAQAVREVARGDVAVERAIREWVGGRLIVDGLRSLVRETSEPSGGLDRGGLDRGGLDSRGLDRGGIDRAWIAGLRRSYLVRTEARAGATWHELSHDRFVEPVLEDNERWEQAHLHPVQVQAKLWVREGRRPGLLLEAEALDSAREWAEGNSAVLTEDEREFLQRSQEVREAKQRARRRRRARWSAAVAVLGFIAVAATGVTMAVQGQNEEIRERNEAIRAQRDRVNAQSEALERKDAEMTIELAAQQGMRASMLAEEGGHALQAVSVAVEGIGRLDGGKGRIPFENFAGLMNALAHVQGGIAMLGHTDQVMAVAYSLDGARLATASKDGTVRVWDAQSGEAKTTLEGHDGPVLDVAFSADGMLLVSGGEDKTVRVWALGSGQEVTVLPHAGAVQSVAVAPDETSGATEARDTTRATGTRRTQLGQAMRVASASGSAAWVWHLDDDAVVVPLVGHEGAVHSVVFSPDGRRLATGGGDKTVRVWQADSGELLKTLEGHDDRVLDVAFSLDGTQLVTGSRDKTVRTWDASTGEQVATIEHGEVVQAVALSPDGTRLATATFDDDSAHLWDRATGRRLTSFRHEGPVTDVAFSPRGGQLATVSWDKTARSWNTTPSTALGLLKGHADRVDAVAVLPDGRHIVTTSGDHTARVWDSKTGALRQVLRGHTLDVLAVAVSPDGARVVTGSWDQTARVWDVATEESGAEAAGEAGREAREALLTLHGHTGPVVAVAISPDGTRIATASNDRTVRVWDATTREMLEVFEHDKPVRSAVFTPDGAQLVTVVRDRPAQVWSVVTGQAIVGEIIAGFPSNNPVTAVAYSSDGSRLAVAGRDQSVRLWNWESGELVERLKGHTAPVVALGFSANGARLASASEDGVVRVWASGAEGTSTRAGAAGSERAITSLWHERPVTGVAFVDDGVLATASGSQAARVWSLDPEVWQAWGCAVLDGRAAYQEVQRVACGDSKSSMQVAEWPGSNAALGDAPAVGIDTATRDGGRAEDDGEQVGRVVAVAEGKTEPAMDAELPEVIVVHGVELVLIPGGTFTMGSPSSERGRGGDEGPQHEVTLDSFYIAQTEVTNAQYALYVEANPGVPEPAGWKFAVQNQPDQPVTGISWNEAKGYCDWAGLVLPTEAQWEYAARAGTDTAYWFGDEAEALERFGWFEDNSGDRAHSVGLKGANGYGLYDMHGNVWEWCLDTYVGYETSARAGDGLRKQPDGDSDRVIRGGSFSLEAGDARSAYRYWNDPRFRDGVVGFRPAQGHPLHP